MPEAARIVYIVTDDPAVRRSLERLLDVNFKVVAFDTPQEFLDAAVVLPLGCALVDLRVSRMSGLDVQERLHAIGSALPVIIVTGQGDVQSAVRAMKAGAFDSFERPYDSVALIVSIKAALKTDTPPNVPAQIIDAAVVRVKRLSPRERQVLDALVAGQSNKIIAFELGLSVRTVELHRGRMMERLGVRRLAEAVSLAVLAKLTKT